MNATYLLRMTRLELLLLWRNRTSMFTVVGLPVIFAALLPSLRGREVEGVDVALFTGTGYLACFLIFSVFTHLVTVYTARREDLVLKRLRGGAASDAEILGGTVLTGALMFAVQAVLLLAFLATVLDGRSVPADPLLLAAALAAGTAVFALLAGVVSAFTPTAEMAQITVLPIMFGCMLGSGVMFSLAGVPEGVREAARWLPLTPVVEIARTAYFGQDFTVGGDHASLALAERWLACLRPFAVLVLWGGVAHRVARRRFRWEPRHA
ncbi:ABC transporter permease [Actinomadura miaoliensis]|uniref:ABC transporter permease n=1 Tax=Actinomadura miaoliensis TaxID=430685 RepID=A0ABP7WQV8_9ACTN